MTWPSPQAFGPGDAELDLTSLILTDGLSSRLNKVLVYDKELATAVQSFQNSAEISGWFAVIATARPGVSLAEIEKIVTDEIARLAKTGPTAAELNRAKTKQQYNFVTGLERIGVSAGSPTSSISTTLTSATRASSRRTSPAIRRSRPWTSRRLPTAG